MPISTERAKPQAPGHGEDDEKAERPEQLADHRPELPHPEHVEEDVQQSPVQVDRRDHRPPVPLHHHGDHPGHAEHQGRVPARRQKAEQVEAAEDRPGIHRQADDVENDPHRGDQAGEVDGQPQLAEPGGEPPHPGPDLAAKGTAGFGAAYQLVAPGAEDGGHFGYRGWVFLAGGSIAPGRCLFAGRPRRAASDSIWVRDRVTWMRREPRETVRPGRRCQRRFKEKGGCCLRKCRAQPVPGHLRGYGAAIPTGWPLMRAHETLLTAVPSSGPPAPVRIPRAQRSDAFSPQASSSSDEYKPCILPNSFFFSEAAFRVRQSVPLHGRDPLSRARPFSAPA